MGRLAFAVTTTVELTLRKALLQHRRDRRLALRDRMEGREALVVVVQQADAIGPGVAGAVFVPLHDAGDVGDRHALQPAHGVDQRRLQVILKVDQIIDLVIVEIAQVVASSRLLRSRQRLVVGSEDDPGNLAGLLAARLDRRDQVFVVTCNPATVDRIPE